MTTARASFVAVLVAAVFDFGSIASAEPAPPPAAPIQIGTAYQLRSELLDETRRINVYLPPSYTEGDRAYPVLYLLDGGVREDFVHIAGIASLAAEFRKIREFRFEWDGGLQTVRPLSIGLSTPHIREMRPQ